MNIHFIGVGKMGLPMARHLLAAPRPSAWHSHAMQASP
jgi:3-hydroxyisobutyrate dehydrogenase-like beta-hydroxyacid dehydrogenase